DAESSHLACVVAAGPASVEQMGLWDLTGSEVRIRAEGTQRTGLRLFQPTGDETSWPDVPKNADDPAAWRDLRFVPEMRALVGDGRIDPSLVGSTDSVPTPLPPPLAPPPS